MSDSAAHAAFIEQIVDLAGRSVAMQDSEAIRRYVAHYYGDVDSDDFLGRDARAWCDLALEHWRFGREFPGGEVKQQISREGGGQPRWRRDGKEMYYRTLDNRLMAVDITLGARIEPGVPHQLFLSTSNSSTTQDPTRHMWAALPDGQRFLTRIGTAVRGVGAGAAGTGNTVTPAFTPPGQVGTVGGQGTVRNGLIVLLHWTAALGKASK